MSTEDATSAKLEAALATLKSHDETLRDLVSALRGVMGEDGLLTRVSSIDARLRLLERDRERVIGVVMFAGIVGGAISAAAAWLIEHLKA